MHKKLIEGKKAVFFDLDGTLIDSEPLWKEAFGKVLSKYNADYVNLGELPSGRTIPDKWAYIIALGTFYFERSVTVKELTELTYQEYNKLFSQSTIEPMDGFWPLVFTLKEERKLKLALTTNSPKTVVDNVLKKLGISKTFDLITTLDDVKKAKPDPEMYIKTARNLKVNPREVLVFEDSIAGAYSAVRAGMDLIVIRDIKISRKDYPEETLMFLGDFSGLAGLLDTDLEEYIKKSAEEALQEESTETTSPIA